MTKIRNPQRRFILRDAAPTTVEEVPTEPEEPVFGPLWVAFRTLRREIRYVPDPPTTEGES